MVVHPNFAEVIASLKQGFAEERKAGNAFVVGVAEEAIGTSLAA